MGYIFDYQLDGLPTVPAVHLQAVRNFTEEIEIRRMGRRVEVDGGVAGTATLLQGHAPMSTG